MRQPPRRHWFAYRANHSLQIENYGALWASLITAALVTAACTTTQPDGSIVRHHFGYVQITEASATGTPFGVLHAKTVGVRIGDGFTLGYIDERRESIPLDCRVVIRVVNQTQLSAAAQMLSDVIKEGLCVAIDTER